MTNLTNIKTTYITILLFQIIIPNFSLASDSVSNTESSYDDENNNSEETIAPHKKTQHFCLWEDCRDDRVSFASAQELYEHVRDEHATRSDDNYYKCYWQGCHFEKEGDRHTLRHFLAHCDSVHIKYGAIRCEKCDTKLYYTENRSSHKKRCPGKPPKRTTLAKEGFHCRWKNCRDKDANKIKDGQHLYEHIQEKHITEKHGKMKACLWQGCKFRPNIREHGQPAVFREAILRHCAKEHADFRPFKCPIQGCQFAFYSNATLGGHKKRCSKAKSHQAAGSSRGSSVRDNDIEEMPEESELSGPDQTDEDDENPPVRRSQRLKKRKAQVEVEEEDLRTTKRARTIAPLNTKEVPAPEAPVEAIIEHDTEVVSTPSLADDSVLPQPFDAPVPLDSPVESAVPATVIQDHLCNSVPIDIPTQHFYDQPMPDEHPASSSCTSETSSVVPPVQQLPPVPPPTTSSSTSMPAPNYTTVSPQRGLLGLNRAPPSPSYFVPANPVVVIQPKIYTCRWMGGCGIQFGSMDIFLQHVQQAHLLMCWFSNCGEGPYLNEEALLLHLARKHGCH